MSRARSYHGGTLGALSATGDCRTQLVDTTTNSFIKMMDPFPHTFQWDDTSLDTITQKALQITHEQVWCFFVCLFCVCLCVSVCVCVVFVFFLEPLWFCGFAIKLIKMIVFSMKKKRNLIFFNVL